VTQVLDAPSNPEITYLQSL